MNSGPRNLFVAARRGTSTGGWWTPVGRLDRTDDGYRFAYLKGAAEHDEFRPFPEMPNLKQVYESESLFPLFANRLLSRSRPEYEAFLEWGGFDPADPPDPISILSVTGGHRATDHYEVFAPPCADHEGCFVSKLFVHGMRYVSKDTLGQIETLEPGEKLGMLLDVNNDFDDRAVAVRMRRERDNHLIGYVPRYLARDIWRLCLKCDPNFVQLSVLRVNPDAPLQHRLLCKVRCCWPSGFRPLDGEAFQPIVEGIETVHSVEQEC